MSAPGHVFWLFGLSGAGKSTLAGIAARALAIWGGGRPLLLDGDRVRAGLCAGLGFGQEDRTENLRRAAQVARLGVESGLVVIAAFITPMEAQRRLVAGIIGTEHLSLVHVDAAVETCHRRDVKGLYARALAGSIRQMTGISAEFEAPERADLRLHTDHELLDVSAGRLKSYMQSRLQPACRS